MPDHSILSKHFGAWGKDDPGSEAGAGPPLDQVQGRRPPRDHSPYHATLLRLPPLRLVELLESAHATNRRLHRRCQGAEHEAADATRRYEAIQRPLAEVQDRAEGYAHRLKALYHEEYQRCWRYCWGCRLTWRVKAWVRRWL